MSGARSQAMWVAAAAAGLEVVTAVVNPLLLLYQLVGPIMVLDLKPKAGLRAKEALTVRQHPVQARVTPRPMTMSVKALPRTSKFGYWSNEAQAGDNSTTGSLNPDASASRAAALTAAGRTRLTS